MTARLSALLTHRRAPLILASLAFLLALPALGGGFVMDAYFHHNVLLHRGESPSVSTASWKIPACGGSTGGTVESSSSPFLLSERR